MKRFLVWIVNGDNITEGVAGVTKQYNSWWITSVMASREAPKGTGKRLLRKCINEAKKVGIASLRLGTKYTNYPMLYAALRLGFRLEGCDDYGYVLEKKISL